MTDGPRIQAELEEAVRQREERARVTQRLAAAESQLVDAEARVAGLRARLRDETEDVERLESFSPSRIWATLTGSRAGDLDRETAERDAARYAVAEAEARRDTGTRDVDALRAQLEGLGDVDARYDAALAAKDEWVRTSSSPTAQQLADIAHRRGQLAAEDQEAREAHAAGLAARDLLTHAQQLLASARSWSTWDTFGGGGMLTDMAKYDKLDQATAVLRQADIAAGAFTRELADVGLAGVGGVQVEGLTRAFDIFFDNIFTDMAVRSRIQDGSARVDQALGAIAQALDTVSDKGRDISAELGELDTRREQLLLAGEGSPGA